MAEFDPDEFLKKYGDLSTDPAPYPYEYWDKFGTGVGRGFASDISNVAPYLPGPSMAAGVAGPISRRLGFGDIPDPAAPLREYSEGGATEGPEAAGKIAGEIAPTLLIPETGLGRLAAFGLL